MNQVKPVKILFNKKPTLVVKLGENEYYYQNRVIIYSFHTKTFSDEKLEGHGYYRNGILDHIDWY